MIPRTIRASDKSCCSLMLRISLLLGLLPLWPAQEQLYLLQDLEDLGKRRRNTRPGAQGYC